MNPPKNRSTSNVVDVVETKPKPNRRRNSLAHSTKLNLQELIAAGGHGSTYRNYSSSTSNDNNKEANQKVPQKSHIQHEDPTKAKHSKLKKSILLARELHSSDEDPVPEPASPGDIKIHSRTFATYVIVYLLNIINYI